MSVRQVALNAPGVERGCLVSVDVWTDRSCRAARDRSPIVDDAARLMGQRGFAPTSVDDAIREAKLSGKSHFSHYCTSQEELGYAVLARQCERFTERGLAVLREPMSEPLEPLARFIDPLAARQ